MPETNSGATGSQNVLRAVFLILAMVALSFGLWWIHRAGLLRQALYWIRSLGPWGPVAFIAIFIGAVVLFVPTILLTIGAGFIFGLSLGSVCVLTAATFSGNLAFLIARHFARDWLSHKIESHPKFRAIDDAVARDGWKIVALIRLAPVFPFSIMSYGFGLTRIPWWEYFLANFAMIPGTMMYIYLGTVVNDLTETVAKPPWIKWTVGGLLIVVVLYVTRFARRALAQKVS